LKSSFSTSPDIATHVPTQAPREIGTAHQWLKRSRKELVPIGNDDERKPGLLADKSVDRARARSQKCSASDVFQRRVRGGQTALFVARPASNRARDASFTQPKRQSRPRLSRRAYS
jgi:hypothetical protein